VQLKGAGSRQKPASRKEAARPELKKTEAHAGTRAEFNDVPALRTASGVNGSASTKVSAPQAALRTKTKAVKAADSNEVEVEPARKTVPGLHGRGGPPVRRLPAAPVK